MTEPIRISLSIYQQQRFAERAATIRHLADLTNEAVTTIIADTRDPSAFTDWTPTLTDTEIILTPPTE